jgi:hypothetical protein
VSPSRELSRSRTVFENERLRVSELFLQPKQIEPAESRTYTLVFALSSARLRITSLPDCQVSDVAVSNGQVSWHEPTTRSRENIGETVFHELMIELKE